MPRSDAVFLSATVVGEVAIAGIADSLESRGFNITGGGDRLPEEHLPGPGGERSRGTFVDVTAVREVEQSQFRPSIPGLKA
jgi:hypothetical protein